MTVISVAACAVNKPDAVTNSAVLKRKTNPKIKVNKFFFLVSIKSPKNLYYYALTPLIATPSINDFWNNPNKIIDGIHIKTPIAI